MANGETESTAVLTDQERVELKQLAELILETRVGDRLFLDLVELSAPILDHGRNQDPEDDDGTWSVGTGWASFPTYQAAMEVLKDLLLSAEDAVSLEDDIDQKLTAAAKLYGTDSPDPMAVEEPTAVDEPPATDEELAEILEILDERFGAGNFERDGIAIRIGETVPEFLREAREFGWLDPAALEGAVEFFVPSGYRAAQESLIEAIREAAASYGDPDSPGSYVFIEIPSREPVSTLTASSDGLSPDFELTDLTAAAVLSEDSEPTDTSDEGEWGLAEIDGDGQPEADGGFADDGHDHGDQENEHHGHSSHVHRILEDELRGVDDYDGAPADEREVATLALIAEGILYIELSEILLQDLLAEADPLIRKSRILGADWWLTREATSEVADLLSDLLTGTPWPKLSVLDNSDEAVLAAGRNHREFLKRHAAAYPLDPEPTRSERLQRGTLSERFDFLLSERRGWQEPKPTAQEIELAREIIVDIFGEQPTPRLVEDALNLLSDGAIDASRRSGDWNFAGGELLSTIEDLLLGGSKSYTEEEINAALRTYRTEDLTEDEFIAHYDQSRWPSVGATVDLSIFTIIDGKLQILLIERGNHPEKGKWAVPGGFVNTNESLDQAALRELKEETAVDLTGGGYLEQVKTYGYPGRDRRGFIVSTLYAALIAELPEPEAGDDASGARFVPVEEVLSGGLDLAFDHEVLIHDALERVRAKLEYSPIVFDFLPEGGFTIDELRQVYEIVWGFAILPSDFRRRISQAQGALGISEKITDGKVLWTRGSASTFFPPLDRRQVVRD